MAGQFPTETIQIRKFVGERYWGGRYLDIGAGHPERLSNTFDLYQAAWTGDLYEPNEGFWRKLAVRRPRDVVHPVAVSDSSGWQTFWQNGELSTLEESFMNRASRSFTRSTARVVDARNLTGRYDFCSLDVEGHEGRILRRIDFTRLAIGIFLIESAEFGTRAPTYRDWEDHLLANGYRFLAQFSFLNRFYVHSSYPVTTEIDL